MDKRINIMAIAMGINTLAYSITFPFLGLYLHKERGYPMSEVAVIFLIMGIARIVAPPVCGHILDAFGRRRVLILGPAIRGITFFILSYLAWCKAGIEVFAVGIFFMSFFGMFFMSASDSYVSDITEPSTRPDAYARVKVGLNVGWAIGPAVGAYLSQTPFSLLFGITGALCFFTSFVSYRWCPETTVKLKKAADIITIRIWKDKQFIYFLFVAFLLYLLTSQLVTTLGVFTTGYLGFPTKSLGLLYTINGLVIILLQLPFNKAINAIELKTRLIAGSILYAIGYLSLAWCVTWTHVAIAVVVFTSGELVVAPVVSTYVSYLAPKGAVGRYMGAFGMVFGLGYSLGPYIGSNLYGMYPNNPLLVWGPLALFGIFAAIGFNRLPAIEKITR